MSTDVKWGVRVRECHPPTAQITLPHTLTLTCWAQGEKVPEAALLFLCRQALLGQISWKTKSSGQSFLGFSQQGVCTCHWAELSHCNNTGTTKGLVWKGLKYTSISSVSGQGKNFCPNRVFGQSHCCSNNPHHQAIALLLLQTNPWCILRPPPAFALCLYWPRMVPTALALPVVTSERCAAGKKTLKPQVLR